MQQTHAPPYIPAAGFHRLTFCYDLVVALTNRERTCKQALIDQAAIEPGAELLDLACGTNTRAS